MATDEFEHKYGPWAVVVGASDGVGAEFARAIAMGGVNVVLLARRRAMLEELASSIHAESDVETRIIALDLTAPNATDEIINATRDIEVGSIVYCAGADPSYSRFLEQPASNALAMVQRNCVVPILLCHHFAAPMQTRGRGGIVLVSSGAALVGAKNMVAYSASKAFDMVMAEALWAELHSAGVDVLGLVLGATDTPALRQLLFKRGQLQTIDAPIPGAATAHDVVAGALENLPNGPTHFATQELREGSKQLGAMSRSDAARVMLSMAGALICPDDDEVRP